MNTISIKGETYYCHPIYDQYASNRSGQVINIMNKRQQRGGEGLGNYLFFEIEKELIQFTNLFMNVSMESNQKKKWLSTLTDSNWKKMWLPILMATREVIVSET